MPFALASEPSSSGVNTALRASRMNGSSRDDGWRKHRANWTLQTVLLQNKILWKTPWAMAEPKPCFLA